MPRRKKTPIDAAPPPRYPDLTEAIMLLHTRYDEASTQQQPILQKWIQRLDEIQQEMRHLEHLEKFAASTRDMQKKDTSS